MTVFLQALLASAYNRTQLSGTGNFVFAVGGVGCPGQSPWWSDFFWEVSLETFSALGVVPVPVLAIAVIRERAESYYTRALQSALCTEV